MFGWKTLIVGMGLLGAFIVLDALGSDAKRSSPEKPAATAPAPRGSTAHGARSPHTPQVELTEEQIKELLGALKAYMPGHYEMLMRLKDRDPRSYSRALQFHWRMYERWQDSPPQVRSAWVSLTQTRAQIGSLLDGFQKANSDEQAKLTQKLRELIAKELDAEQVINSYRLAMLEKRIEELRKELQQQAETRDKIIDQRLQRLLEAPPGGRGKPTHSAPRPHRGAKPSKTSPSDDT